MKIKDDVWEAERLLRRRRRHGHCEYLVKWRNYPLRDSTWEPEENILDTGLLAHFNYSLKMRGLSPSGRGRPRKRPPTARSALPEPAKRQRRAAELGPPPSSSSRGPRGPRGRPRIRPRPQPVRERNQKAEEPEEEDEEDDEEEEWALSSEESEEDVEDDVEDEEERENVGRRRRSSRIARAMPPLRRRPLMVTPGQGALSGVKRQDLLLTDVTWDGVTVTIKEDMASKTQKPLH